MNIEFTARARRDLEELTPNLRSQFRKQIGLLQSNLRHPSLQAKKYDSPNDIWQARVSRDYRFYFQIIGDAYRILRVIPHPK